MDQIYRRKLLKMAIASPLTITLALVLNLDLFMSFFCPLMAFIVIWLLPDPIGLKQVVVLKLVPSLAVLFLIAAFMAGLWGMNSIVLFIYILLAGWAFQTLMPSVVSMGFLNLVIFLPMIVLVASNPYTKAVDLWLLMTIGFGMGWLVDRLFWPIFDQQNLEQQVSQTFRAFQSFSDFAFYRTDLGPDGGGRSLENLRDRADGSIRATQKALKTASAIGHLSPSERAAWEEAIALKSRLLAHLIASSHLLQDNRENPLLQELEPELSALGHGLRTTFAGLSEAIVAKQAAVQLPSPRLDFQRWQTRLTGMRAAETTRAFDLASRLAVGLIDHRLEALVTDLSKTLAWLETHRAARPADLPVALEPARS